MKFVSITSAVVIFVCACQAREYWDDLGVTWDANVIKMPTKLPRTTTDAASKGWIGIDSACEGAKGYKGFAWTKDGDTAVTLLFDKQGTIAGIQAGVSTADSAKTGFPSEKQMPPFVKGFGRNVITAYFVDPAKICYTGRSQDVLKKEGTGRNLYIQNGKDTMMVPKRMLGITSPWVEGKCFYTMGKHYWYGISDDMSCEEFFPVFLLYNGGELNGFGWAFNADLKSKAFEHPDSNAFPLFMKSVPKCLRTLGAISTMHIFLDKNPALNFC